MPWHERVSGSWVRWTCGKRWNWNASPLSPPRSPHPKGPSGPDVAVQPCEEDAPRGFHRDFARVSSPTALAGEEVSGPHVLDDSPGLLRRHLPDPAFAPWGEACHNYPPAKRPAQFGGGDIAADRVGTTRPSWPCSCGSCRRARRSDGGTGKRPARNRPSTNGKPESRTLAPALRQPVRRRRHVLRQPCRWCLRDGIANAGSTRVPGRSGSPRDHERPRTILFHRSSRRYVPARLRNLPDSRRPQGSGSECGFLSWRASADPPRVRRDRNAEARVPRVAAGGAGHLRP
jgi:hypothetical protein